MSYKIWWRRTDESIGRTAVFSDKEDAENYLAALKDCGFQCCLRELHNTNPV